MTTLQPTTPDAWTAALDGFTEHLTTRTRPLTPSTLDSYVRDVEHMRDGVTPAAPWDVTTAHLSHWLTGSHWSRRTRLRVLVSLRAFYRWGINAGLCDRSPLVGIAVVKYKRSGPNQQQPTLLWREPIEAFQRFLTSAGRASSTIDHYGYRLRCVSNVLRDPWTVTTSDLADYLAREDWTANTKRMHRAAITRFYAWAAKTGRITTNPAADLESVYVPRHLPRPAPDDALATALAAADDRARLAIELGALAGLRRAEIASLRWDRITATEILIHGKGGHWRRVPLHPDLAVSLNAAHRRAVADADCLDRDPSPFVFPSSHGGHLTPHHLAKIITRHIPDRAVFGLDVEGQGVEGQGVEQVGPVEGVVHAGGDAGGQVRSPSTPYGTDSPPRPTPPPSTCAPSRNC